eukprot:4245484-Pyramimonas_sp.AAC.1
MRKLFGRRRADPSSVPNSSKKHASVEGRPQPGSSNHTSETPSEFAFTGLKLGVFQAPPNFAFFFTGNSL